MKIIKKILSCLLSCLVFGCVIASHEVEQTLQEDGSLARPVSGSTTDFWAEPMTGMEFVKIPGGCFQMGNPDYLQEMVEDEGPVHEVCLDDFYMGRYEVTVGEFSRFVEATGYFTETRKQKSCYLVTPGRGWVRGRTKDWQNHNFIQGKNEPVVCLTVNDARAFGDWLSLQDDGRDYRLPTEAEWEYAARAGTDTDRYWDNENEDACSYANLHDQSSQRINRFKWSEHDCDDGYGRTAPVGSFKPNGFGLYDMLGNVWELTQDWYGEDYYSKSSRNNPKGPDDGKRFVIRGGAWSNDADHVRAFYRSKVKMPYTYDYIGFRLVFSAERPKAAKKNEQE